MSKQAAPHCWSPKHQRHFQPYLSRCSTNSYTVIKALIMPLEIAILNRPLPGSKRPLFSWEFRGQ